MAHEIKETKEVVVALAGLANAVALSLEDDGKLGLSDFPHFVNIFPKIFSAIMGSGAVPKELEDIDETEKNEIVELVKAELNQDENVEIIVEKTLHILFELKQLVNLFTKVKTLR